MPRERTARQLLAQAASLLKVSIKVSIKPTATSVGGQGAAKRQRLAEN